MFKVFLDLDGVLVDFMGGVHKWYGLPYSYEDYPYEINKWDCLPPKSFKRSANEFWCDLPPNLWANLDWTLDGKEILKEIEKFVPKEQICLFTSRSMPQSAFGAVAWVATNLPQYRKRLLIGDKKEFCAHENSLLIDDANHNVDAFIKEGGRTILIPRKWNRAHEKDGTAVAKVAEVLQSLEAQIAGRN